MQKSFLFIIFIIIIFLWMFVNQWSKSMVEVYREGFYLLIQTVETRNDWRGASWLKPTDTFPCTVKVEEKWCIEPPFVCPFPISSSWSSLSISFEPYTNASLSSFIHESFCLLPPNHHILSIFPARYCRNPSILCIDSADFELCSTPHLYSCSLSYLPYLFCSSSHLESFLLDAL